MRDALLHFFLSHNELSPYEMSNRYLALSSINATVLMEDLTEGEREKERQRDIGESRILLRACGKGRLVRERRETGGEKCISMGASLIYEKSLLREH